MINPRFIGGYLDGELVPRYAIEKQLPKFVAYKPRRMSLVDNVDSVFDLVDLEKIPNKIEYLCVNWEENKAYVLEEIVHNLEKGNR